MLKPVILICFALNIVRLTFPKYFLLEKLSAKAILLIAQNLPEVYYIFVENFVEFLSESHSTQIQRHPSLVTRKISQPTMLPEKRLPTSAT